MPYRILLRASASLLLMGSLAACGDDNDEMIPPPPAPTPTPPPGTASFESQFGPEFAAAFNQPDTAEPIDPQPSDVPPLQPTDDPLDNED